MQKRVKSPGTDAVPMMGELIHHGQSEDWFMGCVHQHVNSDKAKEQFPLLL